MRKIAWLTIATLLVASAATAVHTSEQNPTEWRVEAEIYEQINEERTRRGLEPLEYSPSLSDAAEENAENMAEQGRMFHTDNLLKSFRSEGESCYSAAQNVAYSYNWGSDAEQIGERFVDMWMNSPPHRHNIMSDYTKEGISVETSGNRVFASQNFCS